MASKTWLEELEQQAIYALTNPQPKYQLFQRVKSGRIVGYEFVGVGLAIEESRQPGWEYAIEGNSDIHYRHEDSVEASERGEGEDEVDAVEKVENQRPQGIAHQFRSRRNPSWESAKEA